MALSGWWASSAHSGLQGNPLQYLDEVLRPDMYYGLGFVLEEIALLLSIDSLVLVWKGPRPVCKWLEVSGGHL
jgi:hypothetical protein